MGAVRARESRPGASGSAASSLPPAHRTRLGVAALLYGAVAVAPLVVVLVGTSRSARSFWIEFGVALGFIGLAMLCLQSILTARYPRVSAAVGQDTLLQFHRQAGIIAFAFVLAHPAVLIAADGSYWSFLDPRDQFLRAVFLLFVLGALPVLIVTSLWRETFRLPYQWWRLGHGVLAGVILAVGLVHIVRVHHYLAEPWKQVLWVVLGSASVGSIVYVRALKPLRVGRHPYRVTAVEPVAAGTWTVTVEPDGGSALRFRAGQFAFLTLADSPFSLEQHPFSVASSPRTPDRLEFAIKELGDFTATIGSVPVGQRAFVDGPYGSMCPPADPGSGVVMVAGGIGIAPVMSMLRTFRADRRPGPCVLVQAVREEAELAFGSELDEIGSAIDLTLVRVVERPGPDWSGEVGVVTDGLLRRVVPDAVDDTWHAVICGPPPMMEVAEATLLDLGLPLDNIESERFDIGAADAVGVRSTEVRRTVLALGVLLLAAAAGFAW
jgi:predicted ferric reductase